MVILRSQNKIADFFMILAWACLFNDIVLNRFKFKNQYCFIKLKKLIWVDQV